MISSSEATLGRHLARRLVQVGVTDVFSVPDDFNLTLLDHLIAEPGLNLIGCCNELNAGYAADGYARSRGVGACVVTFTVGGLSVINAIAGAYSENLPVICIVGGPNTKDYGTNRILHHTIGLPDFSQEHRCFHTVTCYQGNSIRCFLRVQSLIDWGEGRYGKVVLDRSGRKFLHLHALVNVTFGVEEEREMMGGLHTVADIFCVKCGSKVGWKFLSAQQQNEQYQVGKFILERTLLLLVAWWNVGPAPAA